MRTCLDYYRKLTAESKPALRLPKNDTSIKGRIVDSEGQPVENARIQLDRIWYNEQGSLDSWEQAAKNQTADFYSLRHRTPLTLHGDRLGSLVATEVSTGADGMFSIDGTGNERIVQLMISARGYETMLVKTRTRAGELIDVPHSWDARDRETRRERYYPNEFQLVVPPSVPVVGRIVDGESKQPIPGIVVSVGNRHAFSSVAGRDRWPKTTTDESGALPPGGVSL